MDPRISHIIWTSIKDLICLSIWFIIHEAIYSKAKTSHKPKHMWKSKHEDIPHSNTLEEECKSMDETSSFDPTEWNPNSDVLDVDCDFPKLEPHTWNPHDHAASLLLFLFLFKLTVNLIMAFT